MRLISLPSLAGDPFEAGSYLEASKAALCERAFSGFSLQNSVLKS